MKYTLVGAVGDWQFYVVTDHPFTHTDGKPLFTFDTGGGTKSGELYNTLEHAMAAAIAEKYTGKRGAGGTGVGTAADWFMRMIGADQLRPEPDASGALAAALMEVKGVTRPPNALAHSTVIALEREGYVLARPADR